MRVPANPVRCRRRPRPSKDRERPRTRVCPSAITRIVPPCSATKRRPVPSPAWRTATGRVKPPLYRESARSAGGSDAARVETTKAEITRITTDRTRQLEKAEVFIPAASRSPSGIFRRGVIDVTVPPPCDTPASIRRIRKLRILAFRTVVGPERWNYRNSEV